MHHRAKPTREVSGPRGHVQVKPREPAPPRPSPSDTSCRAGHPRQAAAPSGQRMRMRPKRPPADSGRGCARPPRLPRRMPRLDEAGRRHSRGVGPAPAQRRLAHGRDARRGGGPAPAAPSGLQTRKDGAPGQPRSAFPDQGGRVHGKSGPGDVPAPREFPRIRHQHRLKVFVQKKKKKKKRLHK